MVAEKVGKAKLIGTRPAISQASATIPTESSRHSQPVGTADAGSATAPASASDAPPLSRLPELGERRFSGPRPRSPRP